MNPARGASDTPTNSDSRSASTPAAAAPPPLDNGSDRLSVSEDPPPYTPTPSFVAGESTLEHGPTRPFQSNSISPNLRPGGGWTPPPVQNNAVSASQPRSGLMQVLNNTVNDFITQLDNSQRTRPPQRSWSAYPGLTTPVQTGISPVRPPSPSSTNPRPSSDFVRDFYSAGTGDTAGHGIPPQFAPPPGPPPRLAQSESESGVSTHTIGKPTTLPVVGHPLLRNGKLLVYPKSYECDKCQNVGYKYADPSRPCKRCWNNYAKPFSGPLAYSFSSFSDEGNFQRPLPAPRPSAFEPPGGFGGPSVTPERSFSLAPQPTGSSFSYPQQFMGHSHPVPPPASVVYNAGDPRIGGVLCWQCRGKGNVSFLFDRINCDICGGVGRVFST